MPIYKYKAKKGPKGISKGIVEAESEKEAIEKLSNMGYIPISIEEKKAHEAHHISRDLNLLSGRPLGRIKFNEITIFSRSLASLLKSGVHILEALNIISEQSGNPNLRRVLAQVHDEVKEGVSLSSSLTKYGKLFSPFFIAMVRTGENSGALPDAFIRISGYRAKQEEMLSRFRMALAYPLLMAFVGISTVVFMFVFVIPRLMKIYISMGEGLPLPTRILISMSNGMKQWWFLIIIVLGVAVLVINHEAKTKAGKISFSRLKLGIPVFGNFILKSELSRFCKALALLIKSGLGVLNAIDISIPVVENEIIRNHLELSCKELEQGGSFGRSLKNSRIIPLFMSNLIIVGEEAGRLDEALEEVANIYERDTDELMKTFTSLLEPIMILAMGLIVGFIVIAMLLPIFEINMMAG